MKSFTAINTAAARVLRQVLIALTVMFAAGAIGVGLAPGRFGNTSSMTILPTRSGIYARLDQHERHPSGLLSTIYARLDQHERHPSGLLSTISAPLDQHERHPSGLSQIRP